MSNLQRIALGVLLVTACVPSAADDTADASGPPAAIAPGTHDGALPTVTGALRKNPNMVVAAYVDVKTTGATEVVARYGPDTGYRDSTPVTPVDARGKATLLLFGLAPASTVHAQVEARGPGGVVHTGDLRLRTEALPDSVLAPSVTIVKDDGTASGFVLAMMVSDVETDAASTSTAVVLDRGGRLMWYHNTGGGQALAFDRLPNGDFIVDDDREHAFHEIAPDGTEKRVWRPGADLSADGAGSHEFRALPDGHALLIGFENHFADTRTDLPGGVAKAKRLDNNVIELDGSGGGRVIWSSYPDLEPSDLMPGREEVDPADYDAAHMNSIDVAPDGNLLVSCRAVSTVFKIDRKTGTVIWRMGGTRNQFRFLDDPESGFSKQHDARYLPNGHIRLFDNGNLGRPHESRVVQYAVDETARTARLVRVWRHVPPIFSVYAGSARDSDGHVLVDFTMAGALTEYGADGAVVWEARLGRFVAYRTEPVASLYP